MRSENYPIDVVIPWVDGSDKEWQQEKNRYLAMEDKNIPVAGEDTRYRDWDTLRFVLRGIEKFMPWVRTVHLVTCGQVPAWLNTSADRLHLVKHSDYIPKQYLPTFSSHPIELNMHRIEGLAEHFVYFNDDTITCKMTKPTDYFKNGLPRDFAVMLPLIAGSKESWVDITMADMKVINENFKKNSVIKKHPLLWFNFRYGINNIKTLCLMPWPKFSSLYVRHVVNSFLKSTLEEVWEKEHDILDVTCSHRFRTKQDVNQYLFRFWQICSGRFVPTSPERTGKYFFVKDDNSELKKAVMSGKYRTICVNDRDPVKDIKKANKELAEIFEAILPEKSSFEK